MKFISLTTIVKKAMQGIRHLEYGTLRLVTPKGVTVVAKGRQPGPDAQITLHEWSVIRRVLARGDIALGEDYVAGKWESENIEALVTLFLLNFDHFEKFAHGNVLSRIGFNIYNRFLKSNSKSGSRKNIQAHYDVGNDFYQLWLDPGMTYSSALFDNTTQGLEEAQNAKYQRILNRIGNTVSSVLEIGCGWGGFAEMATKKIANVTCLTISPSQHDYAAKRLQGRADIRLQDYRDMRGAFDAIVSIEMFEAVGEKYWPVYFKTLASNLKKTGTAIVQTIVIHDDHFEAYRKHSDFIRHYIFPGGMLPSVRRFREEAERAGLKCREAFSFGQDYARTLREWLERFEGKREEIMQMGYSEDFIRNWRFYLHFCAAAFAVGRTNVIQAELTHA